MSEVNGALRLTVLQGVGEGDDFCFSGGENAVQKRLELRVGRVVGPHCEHAPGIEEGLQVTETVLRVEGLVSLVDQVPRRVIDVQENGIEAASGLSGVEALGGGQYKEISLDQVAERIAVQFPSEGDHFPRVPADDLWKSFHDQEVPDAIVVENRPSGVSQPQPAHHHGEICSVGRQAGEGKVREGDLHRGEEAGHEIAGPKDDLVDFKIVEGSQSPASESEGTQWCFLIVQLFVVEWHELGDSALQGLERRARSYA